MADNCSTLDKLRSPKIAGMAAFDWAATLFAAFLLSLAISWLMNRFGLTNNESIFDWKVFLLTFLVLIVVAILTHKAMDIDTMLNYYLGISDYPIRKQC